MLKAKEKADGFLKKYGMDYQSIDIEQNCKIFMEEMENGLKGKKSSLRMIPTYIGFDGEIPVNERVIAIDAGGTNFRVAVVHFDKDKKPVIEDFNLHSMPGSNGMITRKEFFETIVRYLEPVLGKSKKIGFCFSYPTEILPNKDGRLVKFCKEVQVQGVDGELIGENLLKAIKASGKAGDEKIVMLNDTVATLLGGKAAYPDRVFDTNIGFILGTGLNACYIEENGNIEKVPAIAAAKGSMIINTESGAYARAPRGKIDELFDSGTVNPGEYMLEKMMSGGYQGGIILAVIKKAAEENLFSKRLAERFAAIDELTSKEVNDYLYYPYSNDNILAKCCNSSNPEDEAGDRMVLYYLIDSLLERAGKLAAILLSAVVLKTGKGKNPCAPVCITADGSTFYKSKLLRGKLDYYIKTYLNEQKGTYCEFVKADNVTLIGTAIAGLLN